MAADRRRRAGARPAGGADRDAAAGQAQAELYAAYGLRRPYRRRQRRKGAADRQQAGRQHLLLAHRLSRRHQGPQQGRDPRRQASRAGNREGGRADGAARPLGPARDAQFAGLCRAGAPARGAVAGAARHRPDEPQECEGFLMSDDDTPENEKDKAPAEPPQGQPPAGRAGAQRGVAGGQTFQGLASLRQALVGARPAPTAATPTPLPTVPVDVQPKRDALGRSYATGKRKNAVARVWIKPGNGKIEVNGRDSPTYFARPVLRMLLNQPFVVTDRLGQFDVWCTVTGGGLSGQAGAVRHGISKALTFYEPGLRPVLKHGGFLTRDSRVVERKKYGKAKARRSFQFSKR